MGRAAITGALHDLVGASGIQSGHASMMCSRRRWTEAFSSDPRSCETWFFATITPIRVRDLDRLPLRGATLWVAKTVHRSTEDPHGPRVKSAQWGDLTDALFEAKDAGGETAVLLDHQGRVTEGPGYNVIALFGDASVTPAPGVLLGVSRQTVLEMAVEAGLTADARNLPLAAFLEADEIFLSTSAGGIGAQTLGLMRRYRDWLGREVFRTPITYDLAEAG